MSSKLEPQKTFAILMGCSRFDGGFDPIPPVENNLRDLEQLLLDDATLGLQPNAVRTIPNETSGRAIKLFKQYVEEAKAAKFKTLVFYYAGHGYRRTDKHYFLTATDSDAELINLDGTSGISFSNAIEKVLKDAKISQYIILLDACSSGTVAQGDEDNLAPTDLRGSYTLTSSADREDSLFDKDRSPYTFFTAALLEIMREGMPTESETITLAELYNDIKRRMKERQYPMSPRQRTTDELQPHAYIFCKNKAFDGEKIRAEELNIEIQEAIKDLEAGMIPKAKRNLTGILQEIATDLSSPDLQAPLRAKVEQYLEFCRHYPDYRPIFEKILGAGQAATFDALTADNNGLKTALAAAKGELAAHTKALAELNKQLADKTTSAQQASEALAKHQTTAAATEEALQTTIAKLKKQLANTQKQLAERNVLPAPPANMNMIHIKGGTYDMGDVMGDKEESDETVHRVTVSDFYLGRYAVTFEEYDAFCEATKREKPGDEGWGRGNCPVINVSWYDAVEYCNWLSGHQRLPPFYTIDKTRKDPKNTNGSDDLKWMVTPNWNAKGYRLPTEAEWEYAAREGGKRVRFGNGKDEIDPKDINFDGSESYKMPYSVIVEEIRGRTVPVGSLNSPNALGLHDMSGNVWEWCWDWYGSYPTSAQNNPKGADKGAGRVIRGGGWNNPPRSCRAAYRSYWDPTYRNNYVGFRLARS